MRTNWQAASQSVPPSSLSAHSKNLPELPDDLAEAFDAMKLAILRHKRDDWQEIAVSGRAADARCAQGAGYRSVG